jgi:hypothetical protein
MDGIEPASRGKVGKVILQAGVKRNGKDIIKKLIHNQKKKTHLYGKPCVNFLVEKDIMIPGLP